MKCRTCGDYFKSENNNAKQCEPCRLKQRFCPDCGGKKYIRAEKCMKCARKDGWSEDVIQKIRKSSIRRGAGTRVAHLREQAKLLADKSRGKTYEERYGEEKAKELRERHSATMIKRSGGVSKSKEHDFHAQDHRYRDWRNAVFKRDKYTCRACGRRGLKLEAHHIKPWAKHPELRYEVSNGAAVCVVCHKRITKEQNRKRQSVFEISKEIKISASHQLMGMPEGHPCGSMHGHNYVFRVWLRSKEIDDVGMVLDYNVLDFIKTTFDHRHINDVIAQPTAENIVKHVHDEIKRIVDDPGVKIRVSVKETDSTEAMYYE